MLIPLTEKQVQSLKLIVHNRIMCQIGSEKTAYNEIADVLETFLPEIDMEEDDE